MICWTNKISCSLFLALSEWSVGVIFHHSPCVRVALILYARLFCRLKLANTPSHYHEDSILLVEQANDEKSKVNSFERCTHSAQTTTTAISKWDCIRECEKQKQNKTDYIPSRWWYCWCCSINAVAVAFIFFSADFSHYHTLRKYTHKTDHACLAIELSAKTKLEKITNEILIHCQCSEEK